MKLANHIVHLSVGILLMEIGVSGLAPYTLLLNMSVMIMVSKNAFYDSIINVKMINGRMDGQRFIE